ncbi:OmpA family protein [Anaplasmataceae bacterium AB001_6]|nr:OmpA family protein [Anaplasmataceae bacterium AB001_6]
MFSSKKNIRTALATCVFGLALAGCPGDSSVMEDQDIENSAWQEDWANVCPSPVEIQEAIDSMSEENWFIVHFKFDQSALFLESQDLLDSVADCMSDFIIYKVQNGQSLDNVKFLVEGHCDVRGSAEYNIGLGGRRSNSTITYLTLAVEKYLRDKVKDSSYSSQYEDILDKGFINSLFCVSSKGSSELIADGTDEMSHALNRRSQMYVVNSCSAGMNSSISIEDDEDDEDGDLI